MVNDILHKHCLLKLSFAYLTFRGGLGTGKDSLWETGAMDDGMFGYVKAFLPLTFRYFRIFTIQK